MRRILRRILTQDARGRVLANRVERLADDGRGHVHYVLRRTADRCTGCGRAVEELSDLRGHCDYCRRRRTCNHCETRCAVCSRRLCGLCRRGFPGPPPLTACPICQHRLMVRQAYLDRLAWQERSFQQRMALHREHLRLQQLRLHAARLRSMGQLAAMRERSRFLLTYLRRFPYAWRRLR